MKTTSNNNTNYIDTPQYYLNGLDRSQLGILSLAPDIEAYWEKVGNGLSANQKNLTVLKTKNDKVLVLAGGTCIGFINGSNVDPRAISKYLHAEEMVFTKLGGEVDVDKDLSIFG